MSLPRERQDRIVVWTAAITGVALLLRLVLVALTDGSFRLGSDPADYQRLAESILDGDGFGTSQFAPAGGPTALRPPGFPLWLALVEGVTGGGVQTARAANAIIGASVVPATVALARLLRLETRTALIAGAVVAVTPQLVLASTSMLSEALFVPLSLACVVAALAFRESGSTLALAGAAVAVGLAIVTRPVGGLLLLPLALLVARAPLPRRTLLVRGGLALVVALLPAIAWEIRTIGALDRVVPLTTQGGYLLAGTYNATSAANPEQPAVWIPANFDPHMEAVVAAHPDADEPELSAVLQREALEYLRDHPSYLATVVSRNALRMFGLTHREFETAVNQEMFGVGERLAQTEQIGAVLLLALALFGIARGGLGRLPLAVWLAPALLIASTLPVQSFTRFRGPVDPYLAILAAVALAALFERRRRAAGDAPARAATTIDSLTAMRFAAALIVVLLHASFLLQHWMVDADPFGRVAWAGQAGVSFFFILSGFVLTWSARQDDTRLAFARRRFARIVPLHVLTWAITGAVYAWISVEIAGGPALASFFLLHTWIPDQDWFGAMNTPSWSLGCELFFYALFPVLLAWISATGGAARRRIAAAALLVPLAAALLTPWVMSPFADSAEKWLVVNAPPVRLSEFVLGILLALAVKRGDLARIPLGAAAVACLAALVLLDVLREPRWSVVIPLVPFALLIAALAHRELAGGVRWLRRPIPVRLGQWSFALYLIHWPVLVFAGYLREDAFGSNLAAYAAMAGVVVLAVALAGVLFTCFERPFERLLRPRHDEPAALRSSAGTEPSMP